MKEQNKTYRVSIEAHNDIANYGSYDLIRKIASIMDGQKNAARKVLSTVIDRNITGEIKVSQLSSKVSEDKEYLHGNLDGVVVNMAQNFAGSNNLPILVREGNFGTRFITEASASRYIYTHKEKYVDIIFNKMDTENLEKQFFEGNEIEPKFYLPSIPMLIVNGSEGISTGFAQKILSRDIKDIISKLKLKLSNKNSEKIKLIPSFNKFNGIVESGDSEQQWIIKGIIKRISAAKIEITEIPIGYSLKDYLSILDDLEDKGVIKNYTDKSENDIFNFEVQFDIKTLKESSDDEIMLKLKLIKRVSENYTCMDETNTIVVYENIYQIFEHYYKIKLQYMQKRKDYIISKIDIDIKNNYSKYIFIKSIIDGNIIVNNKKKTDIITQIEKNDKILKLEDSYDYLLRLPVYSLTFEKMEELKKTIEKLKEELDEIKLKTPEEMWLKDIEELEKALK